MATLQHLLARLLAERGLSVRALAESTGIGYPTLLAVVNEGRIPRKVQHREVLRSALGLDAQAFAAVLAASGDAPVAEAGEPPTLQQLVVTALYAHGHTEQTLARATGIAYPTLLNLARKGAVPRADTLARIAEALELDPAAVAAAVARSQAARRAPSPPPPAAETGVSVNLAQLVSTAIRRRAQSVGAFAREHDVPYLSLMRLVTTGVPPSDEDALDRLRAAVGGDAAAFASALARSRANPEPAPEDGPDQGTPLQVALRAVMERKGLTMKAFAELSELSVLTATRLVKHGALPSRTTTHQKLRALLGIDEAQYEELLRRSQPTGERAPTAAVAHGAAIAAVHSHAPMPVTASATAPADDEFQHRETEEITPVGEEREALAPRSGCGSPTTSLCPAPGAGLMGLIAQLDAKQQKALQAFLVTIL